MKSRRGIVCGFAATLSLATALPALAASSAVKLRPSASAPIDLRPQASGEPLEMDFDVSDGLPAKANPSLLPRPAARTKPRKAAAVPLPRPNPRRLLAAMPDPLPVPVPEVASLPGASAGSGASGQPGPDTSLVTGSTAAPPGAAADVSPAPAPVAGPPDAVSPPSAAGKMPPIAVPEGAPPYELVRILQLTQDRMAAGDTDALAAQRDLFSQIDHALAAADPAVWLDPRNAAAAVTYVLSGGPPTVLKLMLSLKTPPAIDQKLLRGSLAYVEGREAEALTNLLDIDATTLPASMGGQMALAQAALAVRADPPKAMALLDTARLIAPGTLVEEAALRREIFLADQAGDEDKFEQLTRTYLDRFRHSVYAGNFRNRFEAALSHTKLLDTPDRFARIQTLLEAVESPGRTELYLTVARAAALQMKLAVAALAAGEAKRLAATGSVEEARALLYGAAALVITKGSLDTALSDLKSVDRAKLTASDQMLFDSVSRVADAVRNADAHPGTVAFSEEAVAGAFEQVPAVVTKAMEALRASDVSAAKEKS